MREGEAEGVEGRILESAPAESDGLLSIFRAESIVDGNAPDPDASWLCSCSHAGCLPLPALRQYLQ